MDESTIKKLGLNADCHC